MEPTPNASGEVNASTSTLTFNSPRTISYVLIQFIVLWVGAIIAHSHLSQARHMSRRARVKSLALFLVLPTFAAASLVCRASLCLYIACTKPWPSDRSNYMVYLASATLGLKTWSGITEDKSAEGGAASVELLDGDFEDYQRAQCSCTKVICSRWNRRLVGQLAILGGVIYICTVTLFLYIQRCSQSWQVMAHQLLTGTPPGQHDSELLAQRLDTVSGMDELNAAFAFGGLVVSTSAVVLKLTGWTWQHKSLGVKSERNQALHLRSIRHSCMDARFELPVAMLMHVAITHNTWYRLLSPLSVLPAGISAILGFAITLMALGFFLHYILWTWRIEFHGLKGKSSSMFMWGILLVSEWTVLHAWEDIFDMRACLAGGQCPRPLFMWKNPWSDKLWSY